jgi:hypothetical protein
MPGNAILRDSIDTFLNQQLAHVMRPVAPPKIVIPTGGPSTTSAAPAAPAAPIAVPMGGGGGGRPWGIARLVAIVVGMLLIIFSVYMSCGV